MNKHDLQAKWHKLLAEVEDKRAHMNRSDLNDMDNRRREMDDLIERLHHRTDTHEEESLKDKAQRKLDELEVKWHLLLDKLKSKK